MNVLIQGVGGIGGVTAAKLVEAGLSVTPVTGNPAIAQALNTHGFQLEEPEAAPRRIPLNLPASATVPEDGARYDLIILATQSTVLEDALRASRERLSPDGVVVCFQNGLPEDRASTLVDPDRVLGCVVGWGASMVQPGRYVRTSSGGFQLGRLTGGRDDVVDRLEKLLTHVAPVQVTPNLPGVRWSKLAINSAITTLGAVGGDSLGRLLRHRFVRRLALEVFTEVVTVARANEVRLEKVNGTFDLDQVILDEVERRAMLGSPSLFWKHSLLVAVGLKYRKMRSSMLYALERGRTPEVEFLNGEVVRRAEALGLPTPVNRRLMEAIADIAAGRQRSSLETLRTLYEAHKSSRMRGAA